MRNTKRKQLFFGVATVLMIASIALALISFNRSLTSHVQSDVEIRLQESMEPNIVSFHLQVEEQIKKVNTFASFLGENWSLSREVQTSLLQSAVAENGLLRCALAYPDGSFITHDSKNEGNVSNDAFFIANMEGEFFITDPRPAVVDPSKRVILFAAPVHSGGKMVGSVIYSYLCDDMDKIFNLKSMGGEMNMVAVKQSGDILIGTSEYAPSGGNLLETMRARCTHMGHTAEECLTLSGECGVYLVSCGGQESAIYVRYSRLNFNDWYLLATIPAAAATESIAFASKNQRELSLLVAAIIFAYVALLLVSWILQRKMVDADTGALTTYAFKHKAKKILKKRTDQQYVVVKLDVKDFKLINRIHSFSTGDKIIHSIAKALSAVLDNEQSIFARIGVDVFVLLLPYEGRDALNARRQAFIARFRSLMGEGFSTKIIFPTGQYVLLPGDFPRPDLDEILEKVNFAHRAAKQNSDTIIDYEEDIESSALFEKRVEDRMEHAINQEEFTLYLQPKVHLSDESLCGAEGLVRWKIGDEYYMYPTDFVPILEKNGFIVQLDKYTFSCAAKFIRECIDKGITPIPISVNFSRHHLNNANFVDELCAVADSYDVPRSLLEVELTESAFVGDLKRTVQLISDLHTAGFHISMDDFGSGYSSFAQLKDLKIDTLKLDRGFFSRSDDEARARAVIAGILRIAQELHITTVAEGVERRAQVDMLRTLGCDIVQGYYYSRPIPAAELDVENFSAAALAGQ